MKAFIATAFCSFLSIFSLHAQDKTAWTASLLVPVLNSYFAVKDALVNSDAATAATQSAELLRAISDVDTKSLSADDRKAFAPLQDKLAFDARHISETKELEHQRSHFTSLSANIYALAKAAKLSAQPVYQAYCPMKKAYWLSKETAIRNPYYGKSMLSCGKVSDTIQ